MPDSATFNPIKTGTPSADSTSPSFTGTGPPRPWQPSAAPRKQALKVSSRNARLIGAAVVSIVAIIFVIQNFHAANVSFLGIHLLLPLTMALSLAAVAGSLLTIAAGPVRTERIRKFLRRSQPRPTGS
jgi:uncharacterized integral membrane protein